MGKWRANEQTQLPFLFPLNGSESGVFPSGSGKGHIENNGYIVL